ncbi:hypothetical protein PZB75_02595 [Streptomyces sp. AM 4-1-1]|uniref:hypothetical protein n=1 Tax=Streptomyces sp. AM 4-1-1 TaxID=3028710 RepID=UPI0023BA23E3|nr:hypothetical protein [Streptomyces sp. AM 4-1-1]WEH32369.1 hypothetical protein PZB75_02595 [Streptomyces sp. AM 4-1-1]
MHRTRIIAKFLVGVAAVTALSGCVSVSPQQGVPARTGISHPDRNVAPQIARPPVRDTLEAVPDPVPSHIRPTTERQSPAAGPAEPDPPRRHHTGTTNPHHHRAPDTRPAPVLTLPGGPVGGADVCALGRGYGRWPANSPQARICEETYGR